MLEFYEFNTFNISVVLVCTFIIYILLTNFYSHQNNDKKNSQKNNSKTKIKPSNSGSDQKEEENENDKTNDEFNLEYLLISFFLSILISLGIAYLKTAKDEEILTEPFWDKLQTANVGDVE